MQTRSNGRAFKEAYPRQSPKIMDKACRGFTIADYRNYSNPTK